jgi:hypothetical protein
MYLFAKPNNLKHIVIYMTIPRGENSGRYGDKWGIMELQQ